MRVRVYTDAEGLYHWEVSVRGKTMALSRRSGYGEKSACVACIRSLFPAAVIDDDTTPRPLGRTKEQRNWCPPV